MHRPINILLVLGNAIDPTEWLRKPRIWVRTEPSSVGMTPGPCTVRTLGTAGRVGLAELKFYFQVDIHFYSGFGGALFAIHRPIVRLGSLGPEIGTMVLVRRKPLHQTETEVITVWNFVSCDQRGCHLHQQGISNYKYRQCSTCIYYSKLNKGYKQEHRLKLSSSLVEGIATKESPPPSGASRLTSSNNPNYLEPPEWIYDLAHPICWTRFEL